MIFRIALASARITYNNEKKRNDRATINPGSETPGGCAAQPPYCREPASQYSPQYSRVSVSHLWSKNRSTVSMHKFINSKGKQISHNDRHHDFYENGFGDSIKAAKLVAMTNPNFNRKRLPAIDKIQEELKDMKSREDELR